MRDRSRWHLNDVQRFFVVIAVCVALFLAAMSLGWGSIVLLLVALLLLVSAGLGVFLLGLRYNERRPAQGSAYVIMVQPPPVGKIVGRCDMRLLVELPGGASRMVKVRDHNTHVIKWPRVGTILPVDVDPRNPRQVRVRWELIEPHHTRAATPAEEAAAFAVPFFTEFADDPGRPRDQPGSAVNDAPPPPTAVALDEDFPPAPGPEADPEEEGTNDPSPRGRAGAARRDASGEQSARAAGFEVSLRTTPQRAISAIPAPRRTDPARVPGAAPIGLRLSVTDLARSVRFYRDRLDFAVVSQSEATAALTYRGVRVLLRQVAGVSPTERGAPHLQVEVADVQEAYQYLRARGVSFADPPHMISDWDGLELWEATFHDPDGYEISLVESRPRGSPWSTGSRGS